MFKSDEVIVPIDILHGLNEPQLQAVVAKNKQLLVLAGAGSGKTRVLVHRIANFIQQGETTAYRVLAVTFTNKAAKEMKERLAKILGAEAAFQWVGTFHGIAHKLLRRHWQEANLPENFQVIDGDDQTRLIKRIISLLNLDPEEFDAKELTGFISRLKDEGKRYKDLGSFANREEAYKFEVYRLYEEQCERSGLVDFSELLLRAYELWQQNFELLDTYKNKFTHILVDEFQDTNGIQYAWLKKLCNEHTSITVVGDDDQSIYSWRGAKIENIQKFTKDFKDTMVIRLEQNYRSTSSILEVANGLIANNTQRMGKELWTKSPVGEKISLYIAFNEIDEAQFIASEIEKWHKKVTYDDIAILYRSNAQSRVLEQVLRQQNIRYQIYGGLRFFDRAEIKDALAYLRLLININDDASFDRVINTPPRGIGEKTVDKIRGIAAKEKISLVAAAYRHMQEGTNKVNTSLQGFFSLIAALTEQLKLLSLPQLVEAVLQQTGLLEYVQEHGGEKSFAKIENLRELITATKQFCETNGTIQATSLSDFLGEISLDAGDRNEDVEQSSVRMMTLHAAKGLEFKVVFIAGLEEGLFPHHRTTLNNVQLEEERRLCYVGITRAMQKLYLLYAEKRAFAGRAGINRPSRFLEELPKTNLEIIKVMHESYANRQTPTVNSNFNKSKAGANGLYGVGKKVIHKKFGIGTIMDADGVGETLKLQIKFDKHGIKWLVLAYANLEFLS